jgi:hypothetical protein
MIPPVRASEFLKKHSVHVIATRLVLRRFVLAWLFLLAGVGNATSGCSSSGSPGLADARGGDAESPGLADAEGGDAAESPGLADAEVGDANADAGGGDANADAGGGDATADAGRADATTIGPIVDSQAPVDSGQMIEQHGEVSTTYPAFTAAQLLIPTVKLRGGPVITNPKIVVVTFANDPDADLVNAFNDQLIASTYWQTTTNEYGVGPLTIASKVRMAAPAASLDAPGVEALLTANLGPGGPLGPSDGSTLYALYFPSATSLSRSDRVSCGTSVTKNFLGYHSEIQGADGGGIQIAYAVIARCPSPNPYVSSLEQTFSSASHEYVEWATDPYIRSAPAYFYASPGAWNLIGPELGDLCEPFVPFSQFLGPLGDSGQQGLFQRTWSNASALALHHPCVPVYPGDAYFNSSPDLGDALPIGFLAPNGSMYTVLGVKVPVGTSRTIAVRLFSDRDTRGPWDVYIDSPNSDAGTATDPRFTYAFDRTSGQNGEILNLTITGLPNTELTDAGTSPVGSVIIWSRSKQLRSYWPFFVAN